MTRRERVTAAFARSTPAQKALSIIAGLTTVAVFVGILAGCARWAHEAANNIATKAEIDSLYVRQTTFAVFQQGLAAQHQRDSLIQDARAVRAESKLDVLVAACRKRGDCL